MIPLRVVVLLLAPLLAIVAPGCGGKDATSSPPPSSRGVVPLAPERKPPAPSSAPEPVAPKAEWPEEARRLDAGKQAGAKPEPERDYSAELLAALGDTSSCIKPRLADAAAASEVRVELEAHVMEAGNIGRSYVSSGQLDGEESECIRHRLDAVRLHTPIDQAPRTVSASLKLALKTAANAAN